MEAEGQACIPSRCMQAIFKYLATVAVSSHPVLILGETGTGKELLAKAVHAASGREGRFVTVNIAGLDDHFFSDTLFGHARGGFTGAEKQARHHQSRLKQKTYPEEVCKVANPKTLATFVSPGHTR